MLHAEYFTYYYRYHQKGQPHSWKGKAKYLKQLSGRWKFCTNRANYIYFSNDLYRFEYKPPAPVWLSRKKVWVRFLLFCAPLLYVSFSFPPPAANWAYPHYIGRPFSFSTIRGTAKLGLHFAVVSTRHPELQHTQCPR